MTSRLRIESSTGIYHVMQRGNNKHFIFEKEYEKRQIRKFIAEHLMNYSSEIYAYCIMGNHLHLLIKSDIKELSNLVHDYSLSYASYYNWKYESTGHVFQGRFRSECIESEEYFWSCMRYIHRNPVKAGMVDAIEQYPYSSAREYISGQQQILHKKAFLLNKKRFGDREHFLKMHSQFDSSVFFDTEEDHLLYYRDIMLHYIVEIQHKYSLDSDKIVTGTPKYRNELKKMMRDSLKISRRMADFIFDRVISGNDLVSFEK